MKIQHQAILLFITGLLVSCQTPKLVLSKHLTQNSEVYEVDGLNGWRIGQKLAFGEFVTSKVKRGWTKSYDYQFYLRFSGTSQKMSFTQFNGVNNEAQVSCLGKLKSEEVNVLSDVLSIQLKGENYFAGDIVLKNDIHWNFIVYNPDGDLTNKASGYLKSSNNKQIEIRGLSKIEGQADWVPMGNLGYEFILDGHPVGAISTLAKGEIWLSHELDDEERLLLSALSSALLLRDNLEVDS